MFQVGIVGYFLKELCFLREVVKFIATSPSLFHLLLMQQFLVLLKKYSCVFSCCKLSPWVFAKISLRERNTFYGHFQVYVEFVIKVVVVFSSVSRLWSNVACELAEHVKSVIECYISVFILDIYTVLLPLTFFFL